eukprot:CAMPEP_0194032922 /NCGR_PEP_ID=MMETSP0009_2-20130614/5761_1 /TAXON_ID=210454 /ORGANISM="Grammatophora oceanica, Strain CCMP 410" /LENGTH=393 /DNA_ID=CAMNT_0038673501 /DNA_START=91 /DNA_END=1272 /DNA_ORIENTATION=+
MSGNVFLRLASFLAVVLLLIAFLVPVLSFRSNALSKSRWCRHDQYCRRPPLVDQTTFGSFLKHQVVSTAASATTATIEPLVGENQTSSVPLTDDGDGNHVTASTSATKSKLLLEFEEKMNVFYSYTEEDIACIANRRDRALFEGVAASRDEPLVYRAFAVLFEELFILRVAGRAIYKRLKNGMDASIQHRKEQVERLAVSTGLSEEEIAASWTSFLEFAPKVVKNEGILPLNYFRDTGMAETLADKMGYSDVDSFLQKLVPNGRRQLNFEQFMMGLHACAVDDDLCTLECDLSNLLQQVIEGVQALPSTPQSAKQLKHEKRYAEMLDSFDKWKDMVPDTDGFWVEVLRGCLQGAQNPRVVEALKIVYVDDTNMRLAGNAIFLGVRAVVAMVRK